MTLIFLFNYILILLCSENYAGEECRDFGPDKPESSDIDIR